MERLWLFSSALGFDRGGGLEGHWHFKVRLELVGLRGLLCPECVCGKGELVAYIFG